MPTGEGAPKFRFSFDAKKCKKIAPANEEDRDLFEKYENFGNIFTVDTLAPGQVQERNTEIESLTRVQTPQMGKFEKEDSGCCLLL